MARKRGVAIAALPSRRTFSRGTMDFVSVAGGDMGAECPTLLRIYIGHLRHKLGDDSADPKYISNEPSATACSWRMSKETQVMAVRQGENAFLLQLDKFLAASRARVLRRLESGGAVSVTPSN